MAPLETLVQLHVPTHLRLTRESLLGTVTLVSKVLVHGRMSVIWSSTEAMVSQPYCSSNDGFARSPSSLCLHHAHACFFSVCCTLRRVGSSCLTRVGSRHRSAQAEGAAQSKR